MEKKKGNEKLSVEITDKISTLLLSAFGLVAALAWNDAIRGIFNIYFPKPADNVWAQLIYAIVITIIVVVITIYLIRPLKRLKRYFEGDEE